MILVDHCIDMLRQNLICNADAGMIPNYWVEGRRIPMPDFYAVYRCRNFESLQQWFSAHEVKENVAEFDTPAPDEMIWLRGQRPYGFGTSELSLWPGVS